VPEIWSDDVKLDDRVEGGESPVRLGDGVPVACSEDGAFVKEIEEFPFVGRPDNGASVG
jgi:hypothetical protein